MSRKLNFVLIIVLGVIIIGLFYGLAAANKIVIHQHPLEKNFLVPWSSLRSFMQNNDDPYGDSATHQTQVFFYGRLAHSNEDSLQLAQPFATAILYLPFAMIGDYVTVRIVWMVLLELALIASPFLCLYLFEWKLPAWLITIYAFSSVLGAQTLLPLFENDKAILIVFSLLTSLIFLRNGRDELAGIFLAITIFLPSATTIFFLVVIWWVIKKDRWRVIWGLLMALGFLFVISFVILPGWFLPFIKSIAAENAYGSYINTYEVFSNLLPAIGNKLAVSLTGGIFLITILEIKSKHSGDFRWLVWAAMLGLALNSLLGIPGSPDNNIFLFAPITLIIKVLSEKLLILNKWSTSSLFMGMIFIFFWVAAIKTPSLQNQFSQDFLNFILPPFLTLVGLYWIRWWIFHPSFTWLDTVISEQ